MSRFEGLGNTLATVRRRKKARYQASHSEVLVMKLALVEGKQKTRKSKRG